MILHILDTDFVQWSVSKEKKGGFSILFVCNFFETSLPLLYLFRFYFSLSLIPSQYEFKLNSEKSTIHIIIE